MLIAQISDTHIAGPGIKTNGVAAMSENLARCVDSVNSLSPPPDLVLLSGDVTNDYSRKQALEAAQLLSRLECPLYVVPGNHDDRDTLRDVFGGKSCPSDANGFIDYVIDGHPLRIIALDSVRSGEPGGHLCADRLAWLNNCLAEGGEQPTVIFMHHPPLKLGIPETDVDGFLGAEQFGAIVANFPNIERVLCGHIHLLTHAAWRGTVVTTAPSTGMQLTLDLTQKAPSRFMLSDPAYLLHHWTPEQILVTHTILLNDLEGPFEFVAS